MSKVRFFRSKFWFTGQNFGYFGQNVSKCVKMCQNFGFQVKNLPFWFTRSKVVSFFMWKCVKSLCFQMKMYQFLGVNCTVFRLKKNNCPSNDQWDANQRLLIRIKRRWFTCSVEFWLLLRHRKLRQYCRRAAVVHPITIKNMKKEKKR